MDNNHKNKNNGSGKKKHDLHHVTPFPVYFKVWGTLLFMTVLTVATSYVDFGGSVNIFIAMGIATFKALLVILFFMGLKYDGAENNATFFVSFLFLAIFILLTSSDELFRRDTRAVRIDSSEAPVAAVDVNAYSKPTPEILAAGKVLFTTNCVTCHGDQGKGDGPASVALNPKPRNFTQDANWKNGRKITQIFGTLTKGLNQMPSFGVLKAEDRLTLANYVRSLGPTPPQDTPQDFAAVQKALGSGSKPKLPIAFALARMEEPDVRAAPRPVGAESRGGQIYQQQCLACHGSGGEGQMQGQALGQKAPMRAMVMPFSRAKGAWLGSKSEFVKTVSEGTPGRGMPGFAQFSSAEWDSLYDYVKALAR